MTDEPISVKVEDDQPGPGEAHQPPQSDPITDPPPRHEPFAHGIGGPGPGAFRSPPKDGGLFTPPRPPRQTSRPTRGKNARLRDKITQTYATVGLVVCAAAETRLQVLGQPDPISPDLNKVRAIRSTHLMNQAGVNTVQMAPAAADAWLELAAENAAVARALDQFMEGGAILGLVMVHAMMLIPYGVAAGWVPEAIGENMATVGSAMGAAAAAEDGD